MINQLNNSNVNRNVFAPLQSSGATYAITKPFTQEQKQQVEVEKEKKSNAFGYGIAVSAVVVGFGVLAAMKGAGRNARHNINKLIRFFEDKTSKLNKNTDKSESQKISLVILKGLNNITKRSKTLFNSAPLKDAAAMHWIEKSPTLKKWSDSITNLFEKISIKTSKRAYSSTTIKFGTMYADFAAANKKIPKEQADIINAKISEIKKTWDKGFSETARNERLIETKNDMNGIGKEVYDATWLHPKDFAEKAISGTFISEEKAAPAKMKLSNKVSAFKEQISISPNDNYIAIRKMLSNVYNFVDQADEVPRTIMKNLKKDLNGYKKALENGAKAEEAFPEKTISENIAKLEEYFNKSYKYDSGAKAQAIESLNNLKSVLKDNKQGELQNIMDIYKAHLSEKDFQKLNKSVNKTIKSLDRSIDMETDKLFDKVRDLLIGAAPVDVLSVISSLGVIGWGLAKADNKDERISAALKYGIPALGAVIISLICTVGLIAGGPSLIIGLVSGVAINKLGVVVDDTRKKYNNKQPILPDPTKILPALKEKVVSVQNKSSL